MNNLPNELLIIIFEHLNFKELIQCSLVCRRFKLVCSCVKIHELIITNAIEDIRDYWFYTNKPLNHRNAIDVTTFNLYRSMFRVDKFRHLHFSGTKAEYDQLNVDDLSQLQQLTIELEELEYHDFITHIDLPNLKIIEIKDDLLEHQYFIRSPKLEMLKCFSYVVLTYPETVKHLEVSMFCDRIEEMRNVEFFQIDGPIFAERGLSILSFFPKMRTLALKDQFYGSNAEVDYLYDAIEQRPQLKIYLECVELDDVQKLDEYCDALNILTYQINNYHSLGENITCGETLNYNELMVACEGKIPDDFTKKYFNVRSISVTDKVESQEYLLQFLKSFDHLRELTLKSESLDQSFYDGLSELNQLKLLRYYSKSIITFDFLFKLKLLKDFKTTADLPTFPVLALELFRNLKYFWFVRLNFETEHFMIIKNRKSNKYEIRRFRLVKGDAKWVETLHLDFCGLESLQWFAKSTPKIEFTP